MNNELAYYKSLYSIINCFPKEVIKENDKADNVIWHGKHFLFFIDENCDTITLINTNADIITEVLEVFNIFSKDEINEFSTRVLRLVALEKSERKIL